MPKKPLPDCSPKPVARNTDFVSEKEIKNVAEQYSFSDSYQLYYNLNTALSWWEMSSSLEFKTNMKTNKKMWAALEKRAEEFNEVLVKLSNYQRLYLYKGGANGEILRQAKDVSRRLNRSARKALLIAPEGQPGRQAERMRITQLVTDIRRVYVEGTGKRDKYTRDPDTNFYHGGFFNFTRYCFQRLGIDKSDDSIANAITDALTEET